MGHMCYSAQVLVQVRKQLVVVLFPSLYMDSKAPTQAIRLVLKALMWAEQSHKPLLCFLVKEVGLNSDQAHLEVTQLPTSSTASSHSDCRAHDQLDCCFVIQCS